MLNGNFTGFNNTVSHNLSNSEQFEEGDSNLINVPTADIFISNGSFSSDGRLALSSNSPAIGAGLGNVDAGMFGGDEPYILSGIPPIPTIYFLDSASSGSSNSGLPISIRAKVNN